jgi:hypothetical protein
MNSREKKKTYFPYCMGTSLDVARVTDYIFNFVFEIKLPISIVSAYTKHKQISIGL